jgi:hypothetical protein
MKYSKIIISVVYAFGVVIFIVLIAMFLIGPSKAINPNAMIPYTWKDRAFIAMGFVALPLLITSCLFYRTHDIKNSPTKKRDTILIFIPGVLCLLCTLFLLGLFSYMLISGYLIHLGVV